MGALRRCLPHSSHGRAPPLGPACLGIHKALQAAGASLLWPLPHYLSLTCHLILISHQVRWAYIDSLLLPHSLRISLTLCRVDFSIDQGWDPSEISPPCPHWEACLTWKAASSVLHMPWPPLLTSSVGSSTDSLLSACLSAYPSD